MEFTTEPNHGDDFWPYLRDPETLARPWAIPGTPGLMHRIGGIEKEDGTGNISYDPDNHERMVRLRAAKVAGIAKDIPLLEVDDVEGSRLLVLGWGGTWGVDPRRRLPGPGPQPPGRLGPPHPPQPVPGQPRRDPGRLRQGARPGAQPGPAGSKLLRMDFDVERGRAQQDQGHPLPSGRDRGLHHGADRQMTETNGHATTTNGAANVTATANGHGEPVKLARKDFQSDQEVRWCPGCGDYSVLTAVQFLLPELGVTRENTVFVSGIGCSSRFPYYMNTYGMHSIHGRAPAVATGIAVAAPTSTCGSSPATATACRSAATTSSTPCAATSTSRSCCSTTRSTG